MILEVFTPGYNKARFDGGELFSMMGGGGTNAQNLVRLIEVMCKNIYAMEAVIAREGPETISAFIAEPILGASAGAAVPPEDYNRRAREICTQLLAQ